MSEGKCATYLDYVIISYHIILKLGIHTFKLPIGELKLFEAQNIVEFQRENETSI